MKVLVPYYYLFLPPPPAKKKKKKLSFTVKIGTGKYSFIVKIGTGNGYVLGMVKEYRTTQPFCLFQVSRKGEAKRFKPFRALDNRMLLWHGSRTTNFAGILAQVGQFPNSTQNFIIT